MALNPLLMQATMLTRAVGAGLIDQPPLFALSRVYGAIARGIILTLLDPLAVIVTTIYGPGQPAIPFGVGGPATAWDDLEPDRYALLAQATAGYFGPFAVPFFTGLSGIIEHIAALVTTLDLLTPTGTGVGIIAPGGVILNPDTCFDNMAVEAALEGLMVVRLKTGPDDPLGHVDTPDQTLADPITGEPLGVGDLFSRAEILLQAIAISLTAELLFARRTGIPVAGPFNPIAPPITAPTITAVVF